MPDISSLRFSPDEIIFDPKFSLKELVPAVELLAVTFEVFDLEVVTVEFVVDVEFVEELVATKPMVDEMQPQLWKHETEE